MKINDLKELQVEVRVGFIITIAEKIFFEIKKSDERYRDGREAIDKCWKWIDKNTISGDELYELIDNPECTGISEFAEEEEDMCIAEVWNFIVDVVSYTAWNAYKKENVKYLPQALEGIKESSIEILLEGATETKFITREEILDMKKNLIYKFSKDNSNTINKESFIKSL